MQIKKIGLGTAFCAFLISVVTVVGCSGADPQDAPADSVKENVEGAAQTSSCGLAHGESASTAEGTSTTVAEDGTTTVHTASCRCCSDFQAEAAQNCDNAGLELKRFTCLGACGLCGRDNAYSSYSASCG